MAALAAEAERVRAGTRNPEYQEYAVKTAAVIYKGGLVCVTTAGRAIAATAAVNQKCVGVAAESKTGNTAGTVLVRVQYGVPFRFTPKTALTKAYLGANVAVSTDNDVTTMSAAGTALVRVRVGRMVRWVSATECWVDVLNFSESDVTTAG